LNISPVNVRGVIPVFKDIGLQLNATLDPMRLIITINVSIDLPLIMGGSLSVLPTLARVSILN
jgi:hypothetical protein